MSNYALLQKRNLRLNLSGASDIYRQKNHDNLESLEVSFSIALEAFKTAEQDVKEIELILSYGDFDTAYQRLIKKIEKVSVFDNDESDDSQNQILDLDSTVVCSKNESLTRTYSLFDEKKNELNILRNELSDMERKRR